MRRAGAVLAVLGTLTAAGVTAGELDPAALLELRVRHGQAPPRRLAEVLADGRPAVVTFWASYCAPCRAEVPALRRARLRWPEASLRITTVAIGMSDPEQVARVAAEWGIDYESYFVAADQDGALERLLPLGLPASFFVGAREITRHDRLLTDADLEAAVAKLLERDGS